jgi:hypothetical protein
MDIRTRCPQLHRRKLGARQCLPLFAGRHISRSLRCHTLSQVAPGTTTVVPQGNWPSLAFSVLQSVKKLASSSRFVCFSMPDPARGINNTYNPLPTQNCETNSELPNKRDKEGGKQQGEETDCDLGPWYKVHGHASVFPRIPLGRTQIPLRTPSTPLLPAPCQNGRVWSGRVSLAGPACSHIKNTVGLKKSRSASRCFSYPTNT